MRISILIFFLIICNIDTLFSQVNFMDYDQEKIQKLSQKGNKLVFLYFTADYCAPCKKFEKEVLNDEEVSKYINEFYIPVKITSYGMVLDDSLTISIKNKYNIIGFPVMIFLNNKDKIIFQKHGFHLNNDTAIDENRKNCQNGSGEESETSHNYHFILENFIELFNEYAIILPK